MRTNLLFDTTFSNINNNWHFANCEYVGGKLISSKKVFGIEQEIVLPDIVKIYNEIKVNILDSGVERVIIGIQSGDQLEANRIYPRRNKTYNLNVVDLPKAEKIKFCVIFESEDDKNIVEISKPLLLNITSAKMSTWIKPIIENTIKYTNGLSYTNLLSFSAFTPSVIDGSVIANIGIIYSTNKSIDIKIPYNLVKGKRYLLKLDYENINTLGNIELRYGVIKATRPSDEQQYLFFRATTDLDMLLHIETDNILPYQVNLKHLMLIDAEKICCEKDDIQYLPFI